MDMRWRMYYGIGRKLYSLQSKNGFIIQDSESGEIDVFRKDSYVE